MSEERLARTLNIDISSIRMKRHLLVRIRPEAADLIEDRHVSTEPRVLKRVRQVEVAQATITVNGFSVSYAHSLVASTPENKLAARKPGVYPG